MVSAAQGGLGVAVYWNAQVIGDVTDISDYGMSVNDIEVTAHDSSGNAEEYISGVLTGGEITLTCNFDASDAGQAALIAGVAAGTVAAGAITLPNTEASTYQFYAYVKSYKIKADLKGGIKATYVLKVTRYGQYVA